MAATAGLLAEQLAKHSVTVTARSSAAGQSYHVSGGSPWGRRVAASLLRNANPGAHVRGDYRGPVVVIVPTQEAS